MLARATAIYFVAFLAGGLLSYGAIGVFTRLLPPAEYGDLALAVAGAGIVNAVFFAWNRLALLRFLPGDDEARRGTTLSNVAAGFGLSAAALALAAAAVLAAGTVLGVSRWPLFWALVLGVALAVHELHLTTARAVSAAGSYAWLYVGRTLVFVVTGALLVRAGLGKTGAVCGALLGAALPAGIYAVAARPWSGARTGLVDRASISRLLRYGLPLVLSSGVNYLVFVSDRLILNALDGPASTGLYSAAFDLTQQTVGALFMVVNLAAFPLAARRYEREGPGAGSDQLAQNATLLAAVSLPACAGMILLSPQLAQVVLGSEYRAVGVVVMPIVALGDALSGWRACWLDHAFMLSGRTTLQVWPLAFGLAVNVGAAFALVPRYSVAGAAVASVLGYLAGAAGSLLLGRRLVALRLQWPALLRVGLATALMVGAVLTIRPAAGWKGLFAGALVGALTYALAGAAFDLLGSRSALARRLRRR